jgi:hypothetical protein
MTGAVNAQDIVTQLDAWSIAGTLLTFTSDQVLEKHGAAIIVKITAYTYSRIPGHTYDYNYQIALQEYSAGNAI